MTLVSAELPGVYLDALSTEAAPARLLVVNRNPEPDQEDVPSDQPLVFDLLDTGAIPGVDVPNTQVYVDGVLAYDGSGGGFQPGYTGAESSVQSPAANVRRITIRPVFTLDSLLTVTMRVVSQTLDTMGSVDTSWDFIVADTTAPRVLTVIPFTVSVVRVTFNEPFEALSALVGANYAFAGTDPNIPAMLTPG